VWPTRSISTRPAALGAAGHHPGYLVTYDISNSLSYRRGARAVHGKRGTVPRQRCSAGVFPVTVDGAGAAQRTAAVAQLRMIALADDPTLWRYDFIVPQQRD